MYLSYMDFKDAIIEVLVKDAKFAEDFANYLANKIMEDAQRLGLEEPTYNLIWSIISRETSARRDYAKDLAEYILELYHRGGYINKTEQEIERILQVLKPKG